MKNVTQSLDALHFQKNDKKMSSPAGFEPAHAERI